MYRGSDKKKKNQSKKIQKNQWPKFKLQGSKTTKLNGK